MLSEVACMFFIATSPSQDPLLVLSNKSLLFVNQTSGMRSPTSAVLVNIVLCICPGIIAAKNPQSSW